MNQTELKYIGLFFLIALACFTGVGLIAGLSFWTAVFAASLMLFGLSSFVAALQVKG